MTSISPESKELATFTIGKDVDYNSSKSLILSTAVPMSDLLLKVRWESEHISIPFAMRVDYYNSNEICQRMVYSRFKPLHQQLDLFPRQGTLEYEAFMCTHIKFHYEGILSMPTADLQIYAYRLDDDKERMQCAARNADTDDRLPDYKDKLR